MYRMGILRVFAYVPTFVWTCAYITVCPFVHLLDKLIAAKIAWVLFTLILQHNSLSEMIQVETLYDKKVSNEVFTKLMFFEYVIQIFCLP